MQVFEDEHQRPLVRDRLEKAAPCGERLVAPVTGSLVALQPRERPQMPLNPGPSAVREETLDGLPQLFARLLGTVGLENAGLGLDDLAESPERDPIPIREGAPVPPVDHPEGPALDGREELEHEAALADSGNAYDRDELGPPFAGDAGERLAQERSSCSRPTSAAPATRSTPTRARARRRSRPARAGLALGFDGIRGLELYGTLGRPVRRLVDEDRPRRRGRLEPGCGIHDVAGGHAFTCIGPCIQCDQRLAGRDADPDLQVAFLR